MKHPLLTSVVFLEATQKTKITFLRKGKVIFANHHDYLFVHIKYTNLVEKRLLICTEYTQNR